MASSHVAHPVSHKLKNQKERRKKKIVKIKELYATKSDSVPKKSDHVRVVVYIESKAISHTKKPK